MFALVLYIHLASCGFIPGFSSASTEPVSKGHSCFCVFPFQRITWRIWLCGCFCFSFFWWTEFLKLREKLNILKQTCKLPTTSTVLSYPQSTDTNINRTEFLPAHYTWAELLLWPSRRYLHYVPLRLTNCDAADSRVPQSVWPVDRRIVSTQGERYVCFQPADVLLLQ